jgi:hypothetical protein
MTNITSTPTVEQRLNIAQESAKNAAQAANCDQAYRVPRDDNERTVREDAIRSAKRSVEECSDRWEKEVAPALKDAEAPLYRAIWFLLLNPNEQISFLKHSRIRVHGNTINKVYPLLKAFAPKDPEKRAFTAALCKLAEVFALAKIEEVEPEQFPEWRKNKGGIDKICSQYRKLKREKRAATDQLAILDRRLIALRELFENCDEAIKTIFVEKARTDPFLLEIVGYADSIGTTLASDASCREQSANFLSRQGGDEMT